MEKKEFALLACVLVLAGVSAFCIFWGYTASVKLASAEGQVAQLTENLTKTRLDYYDLQRQYSALYGACTLKERSFNYTLLISIDDFNLTVIVGPEQGGGSGLSVIFPVQLIGRNVYIGDVKLTPTTEVATTELDRIGLAHARSKYSAPLVIEDQIIMVDTYAFRFRNADVKVLGVVNFTDEKGIEHYVRGLECSGTVDLAWLDLLNRDGVTFYAVNTEGRLKLPLDELGG